MLWIDCTLRDGGYYNSWDFSKGVVENYLQAMQSVGVDYVELGFRSLNDKGFKGAYAFTTDSHIKDLAVPKDLKLGVMVNANELLRELTLVTALEKLFPAVSEDSPVSLVRIACHIHEFEASLPASLWLKQRGYKVGFNLMQVADRSEAEIKALAKAATCYPLDVLYFADSMGSMKPVQAAQIISWLRSEWQGALGIHTHDNLGLALSNTLCALDEGATWVDSTVTGMGRGPGNARTEELAIEIAELRSSAVNMVPLMTLIRSHFRPMQQQYGWGTNPYYYLAGKYGIHPTYIQEMLNDSRYSEEDVLAVIEHLKMEGGKRYNASTLDSARNFYQGEPQGAWCPPLDFHGKNVLLLGAGPSVARHREAIEAFIRKHDLVVVALNTQSAIDAELIHYRVACHPVRLLADCEAHTRLPQPLITPYSMLPDDVKQSLGNKKVLDFGLKVTPNQFVFYDYWCEVPTSLVTAYALALFTSGNVNKVYMSGFDGFSSDDPRTKEMNQLLELYLQNAEAVPLEAITETRYPLPVRSVYAL